MKKIVFAFLLIMIAVIAGSTWVILSQTENQPTEEPDNSNTAVINRLYRNNS